MTGLPSSAPPIDSGAGSFRADIQGLRAVAVLFVLVYHLWPGLMPGGYVGVDVFFVISGYLMTGMLVREAERSGRVSLAQFYARRIRRLLPAATTTLVLVGAASFLFLSELRWQDTAAEIAASAFYVENWWLVGESVDYLALDQAASPVQHFWSLSVEEQFYIVWPLFILFVLWLGRRSGWPLLRLLRACLVVITAASLAYSVFATASAPAPAYFSSATRFWELGLGGLLSLWAGAPATAGSRRAPLVWAGLVAIVAASVLYTNLTAFPGYAALLPTIGTAAVIHAGRAPAPRDPGRFLALRPVQYLGDISYSLYLWHWPAIVFYKVQRGGELGIGDGLLVAAVSIGLAHLSKVFVEDPIRRATALRRPAWRSYAMGAGAVASAAAVALALHLRVAQSSDEPGLLPSGAYPGAAALAPGAKWAPGPIRPTPLAAPKDRGSAYARGCIQDVRGTEVLVCEYGPSDADVTLALVGDSHAAHWVPAFEQMAATRGWRVSTYIKDSCSMSDITVYYRGFGGAYAECDTWREAVLARLIEAKPTVVVFSQSPRHRLSARKTPASSVRAIAGGLRRTWHKLAEAGIKVAAIQHTPLQSEPVLECMSAADASIEACSTPREDALLAGALERAARENPDVHLIDMTDQFCPGRLCLAAIGNVLVYRDAHHMTATYARTLAPVLAARLAQSFEQLRSRR